jgi:DNA-binding NarL/FixJ family response regulator
LPNGLTGREAEVLCLVASGQTNKEMAADLGLSEKTIERHLSNIFTKIGVPTRAAATAFAFEHQIVARTQ